MNKKPFAGTNDQIEQLAAKVRVSVEDHASIANGTLLRRLVAMLGGDIDIVEDPSIQEINGGSLVIRGKKNFTVFLSPYTTPLRDNFTIAHELGHYILHYHLAEQSDDTPLCFTRYGSGQVEWQANRFAAALLMPADKIRDEYNRSHGNISLLSGMFDVSVSAVEIRVQSLGLRG